MPETLDLSWEHVRSLLLTRGLRIAIIIGLALGLYRLVKVIVPRIQKSVEDDDPTTKSEREKRSETLGKVVTHASRGVVGIPAIMGVLRELGFDIGPLIAGAGIAGLAVGFGAQNLVRDVITGFFILFENQLRVGDVVQVAGKTGTVEAVSLRTTILRDGEGCVHIIPNGTIDTVTNMSREWSRAVLDVSVAYKEDVDRVIQVLQEVGTDITSDPAWKAKILEPMTILGVIALGPSSVDIRVVLKVTPGMQFEVGRELRRRIKVRFDQAGIEIPYPHMKLVLGIPVPRPGEP
jgi:small conductance mechanosensitive channel